MISDIALHSKRAYLAPFLAVVEVPPEFLQDDATLDLMRQVEVLQQSFIQSHKYVQGLYQSGNNAPALKKEIQQMEQEKVQVRRI